MLLRRQFVATHMLLPHVCVAPNVPKRGVTKEEMIKNKTNKS